ncbi:MAG: bacteriophage holin [Pseudonocardiaceae bacterium]
MPYLISALAVAAGSVVLIRLLIRLVGRTRGLARTARAIQARLADRSGLLAARFAALRGDLAQRRVELARRRHRGTAGTSAVPPAA